MFCLAQPTTTQPMLFIDVHVTDFAPRFKYICNECQYYEKSYVEDCANLPISTVYALEDLNKKLDVFSDLVSQCIERHALL